MNAEELNRLLEKYYKGSSTKEDEMALKEYFSQDNIPDGYEAEKEIFRFYKYTADIPNLTSGFEESVMLEIDAIDRKSRRVSFRKLMLPSMSAAAGIILVLGSYFFIIHRNIQIDTYSDPKIAYDETVKILFEVSAKLNHATATLEPIGKIDEMTSKSFDAVSKSKTLLEKKFRNLGYLKQGIEITGISQKNN